MVATVEIIDTQTKEREIVKAEAANSAAVGETKQVAEKKETISNKQLDAAAKQD